MADDTKRIYFFILCICLCYHDVKSFLFQDNSLNEEFTIESVSNHKTDYVKYVLKPVEKYDVVKNNNIAMKNLRSAKVNRVLKDGEVPSLKPGDPAPSFRLWTISGLFDYPNKQHINISWVIHYFDPQNSAFLDCLWNSDEALLPIVKNDPDTHYLFIPMTDNLQSVHGAKWMYDRIHSLAKAVFR